MLCHQGGRPDVVKLLDFGLVKQVGGGKERVSMTGEIVGTPCYMSPEAVAEPEAVDGRSDIYGLGALGYYMLTGEDVFTGRNAIEVCAKHIRDDPVPPSERLCAEVPERLERLLLDCLQKSKEDRPADAAEVQARLAPGPDLPEWTLEDARAWWEAAYERLRERRSIVSSETVRQTMAVDVGKRANPD
jgi:serine/threonine-protein kinase